MITLNEYIEAAQLLRIEVALIMAIDEVESQGSGFLSSGKIKILFEGHRFYRYIPNAKEIARKYPKICYPKWTKEFYYGGEKEYIRFNVAFGIDPEAAMLSTSWGRFQVMGDEFARLGYETVGQMIDDFKKSEYTHLVGFCKFVVSKNLQKHLQKKQFALFAKGYNGPNYEENQYHIKIEKAYEKFSSIYPPNKYATAISL